MPGGWKWRRGPERTGVDGSAPLDGEPTISALEVLRRLTLTDPDRFSDRCATL